MSDAAPAKSGLFRVLARFFLVRVFVFAVVLLVVYGGLQALGYVIPEQYPQYRTDAFKYAMAGLGALLSLAAYIVLVRLFEGRGTRELALGPGIPLALLGALLGFALIAGVYLIFGALGYAKWDGTYTLSGLAPAIALSIFSGVGEEIVFRGGIFRILEDSFGTLVALLLSSAMFGAIHAGNANATALALVAIALEAGLLLGIAYTVSRNLWLPIGLHFGWNFTEGGIFGAAVSGNEVHGALHIPITGPKLMTGGAFGPEASLVAVAVCLSLALIFAAIAVRNRHWKPLSFRLVLD